MKIRFAFVAIILLSPCMSLAQVKYDIIDLGTLSGGTESFGAGLNNKGQVVGASRVPGGTFHAFLYDGTGMHDLGVLSGQFSRTTTFKVPYVASVAWGINDNGQVIGTSYGQRNAQDPLTFFYENLHDSPIYDGHAFLYDGTIKDLTPSGGRSDGFAINNAGVATGWANPSLVYGNGYAFTYKGSTMTLINTPGLGTLGLGYGVGYGIADGDAVTGTVFYPFDDSAGNRPFIAYPNYFLDIGTFGTDSRYQSRARGFGINANNIVVGMNTISDSTGLTISQNHPFYYDGSFHDLYSLAQSNGAARGINSKNQIVGQTYGQSYSDSAAFIYDTQNGLRNVSTLLQPSQSQGWKFYSANAINESGQITGAALTPSGQRHSYLLKPSTQVLSVGVYDQGDPDGYVHSGDFSAQLVRDAFIATKAIPDENAKYVRLDTSSTGNKQTLVNEIHSVEANLVPGSTFIFYVNSHGFFDSGVNEIPVAAQDDVKNPNHRVSNSGDEHLFLSRQSPSENISDDEFTNLFRSPKWDEVNKLFIIDACYSGGFWGSQPLEDLRSLPKSAILAASAEGDFAYATKLPTGEYVGQLGAALRQALYGPLFNKDIFSFQELISSTTAFGSSFVGQLGTIQDFTNNWGTEIVSNFQLFASSTRDFGLFGSLDLSVPEPATLLNVLLALMLVNLRILRLR